MLIPISQKIGRNLIPAIATPTQYRQNWGITSGFVLRILISAVTVAIAVLIRVVLGAQFNLICLILGCVGGLYWIWGPAYWANRQNVRCRRYRHIGFWQGNITNAVLENLGDHPRPRRKVGRHAHPKTKLTLEIKDESGFTTQVVVAFRSSYRVICPGDWVEMIVLANRPDFSPMVLVPNLYLPDRNLWISDYPLLRRKRFLKLRHRLKQRSRRHAIQPTSGSSQLS